MTADEILDELVALARSAQLEVRVLTGRQEGEGEFPVRSGVCRVRDAVWVILAAADSMEDRIAILADALHAHAPEILEDRYLPPAIRERLEGPARPT